MNESDDILTNEISGPKLKDLISRMWKAKDKPVSYRKKQLDLPLKIPKNTHASKRQATNKAKQLSLGLNPQPVHHRVSEPHLEKPKVISTLFSKKLDTSKPPFYTDADKWYKELFEREDHLGYTYGVRYTGPTVDTTTFIFGHYPHENNVHSYNQFYDDRKTNMTLWNYLAKETLKKKYPDEYGGMNEQFMKISEIKNVIGEILDEELKEADGVGRAKAAAESLARFAAENPEVIKQMREWAKDCQWKDVEDEADIDDMTDLQIIQGVNRYYDGGIRAFIRDSEPTQPPQQNEATFKSNELEGPHTVYVKTGRLAGKTVSVKKHKSTGVYYYLNPDTGHDEPVGTDQSLGLKQNEEIGNKSGSSLDKLQLALDVAGIEPTIGTGADAVNVVISLLRAAKDKEPNDRNKHLIDAGISAVSLVPFGDVVKLIKLRKLRRPAAKIARGIKTGSKELPKSYASEGVGYVYSKDRAKDPKSIKTPGGGTEHWRIKFQSASDLKKHGNTEMSKGQVREAIRELVDEEFRGERLNEYVVPQSKPTPKTVEELWGIIDVLPNGSSISFYNSHNKNPNTTAPWVSIEKLSGHYNLSIEARMDAESQQRILHGFENLRSEDDVTEDEISIALEGIILNLNVLSMYYIEDYGHKHQQPQQTQQIAESKNMNKKELRGLIRESIEEIHEEQEDQQKLLAMKRIQAYAHWGAINAKKHPSELESLFQKIVKDIDDLIKSEGTEVPIKHASTGQSKNPLGVTEETISKTKNLLDQMLSQRRKK